MSNVFNTLAKISGAAVVFTDGTTAPDRYFQGIPLAADGSVASDTAGALSTSVQGLPITVNGRVASAVAAVAYVHNGVEFAATGRIAL